MLVLLVLLTGAVLLARLADAPSLVPLSLGPPSAVPAVPSVGLEAGNGESADPSSALGAMSPSSAAGPREAISRALGWLLVATVRDPDQRLVADAEVEVRGRFWPGRVDPPRRQLLGNGRTDAAGIVRIDLGRHGALRGWSTQSLLVEARARADGFAPSAWREVKSEAGAGGKRVDGVQLGLAAGSVVRGRVVDADGAGVEAAMVRLAWSVDEVGGATGPGGSYELALPGGEWRPEGLGLEARHASHGLSARLELTAGDLTAAMLPNLVLRHSVGVVRGRVRFPSGEPVTGLAVSVDAVAADHAWAPEPGALALAEPVERERTRTDARGEFALRDLRVGRYSIVLGDDEDLQLHDLLEGTALAGLVVDTGDAVVDCTMPYSRVVWRVVDARGDPVAAARVALRVWEAPRATAVARAFDGGDALPEVEPVFRLDGHLAAGSGAVWLQPGSFGLLVAVGHGVGPLRAGHVAAFQPASQEVELRLLPPRSPGALVLTLVDDAGDEVHEFIWRARPSGADSASWLPDAKQSLWHDAPDAGCIGPLAPGGWEVHVVPGVRSNADPWRPYLRSDMHVEVEPNHATSLRLAVRRVARVDLDLRHGGAGRRSATRPQRYRVTLRPLPDGQPRNVFLLRAAEDGALEFTGDAPLRLGEPVRFTLVGPIEPGRYELALRFWPKSRAPKLEPVSRQLRLRPGRNLVEFTLLER